MPFSFNAFPTLSDTDLMYGLAETRLSYRSLEPFKIFSTFQVNIHLPGWRKNVQGRSLALL